MAKTTSDIRLLARTHGHAATATLAGIMREKTAPPGLRVAAANRLLDLGFGKPTGEADPAAEVETVFVRRIVDPAEQRDDPGVVDGQVKSGDDR